VPVLILAVLPATTQPPHAYIVSRKKTQATFIFASTSAKVDRFSYVFTVDSEKSYENWSLSVFRIVYVSEAYRIANKISEL